MSLTNLPADYDLQLYRSNNLVGTSENTGTTNEQVIYNNTQAATTYYAKVYGYNGAFTSASCYTLLAQISGSSFRDNGENIVIEGTPVQDEFLVFPNPATDEVSLVVPFGKHSEGNLNVLDLTGKSVMTQKLQAGESVSTFKMDISSLKGGIYLVTFTSGSKTFAQKLAVTDRR